MPKPDVYDCSDLVSHLLSTIKACSDELRSVKHDSVESLMYEAAQYAIENCFVVSSLSDVLLKFAEEFDVRLVSDLCKEGDNNGTD